MAKVGKQIEGTSDNGVLIRSKRTITKCGGDNFVSNIRVKRLKTKKRNNRSKLVI